VFGVTSLAAGLSELLHESIPVSGDDSQRQVWL
jgi:hypothetical protein